MNSGTAWTHEPTTRGDRASVRRRLDDQTALLGRTSLFQGLSKRHLRAIAAVTGVRSAAAGSELVQQDAAGSVMFLIVEGTAKVVRNGRTVKRLGPGDFFGEMAILTTTPRTASVIADSAIRCVTLSAKDLRPVLMDNPQIAVSMLETMAARIAELDRKLVS